MRVCPIVVTFIITAIPQLLKNAFVVIKGDNSGIVCHTEVTFWHDLSGESSGTGSSFF